tara:strand:- start:961 stop:3267 length:2307 start_codon:yes stop_codon:yes gene_type:complete
MRFKADKIMIKFKNVICLCFLFVSVLTSSMTLAQVNTEDRFRLGSIEIQGNERVTDGTVLAYLPAQVGDEITLAILDRFISILFATNLFSDVSISRDENDVVISVRENPIINRITIEGNDVLTDEKLLEELDIQPRRVYTRDIAINSTKKLLDIYRLSGRFAAEVVPKVIRLENNRIDLIFEVDEGELIKIESIRFIGNEAFSDFALRQVISSRKRRWWAFMSGMDKYDPSRLDYDVRLLRQFYLSRGYAEINVERVQGGLLQDRSGFAVTFSITEGPRFKFGNISIESEIENLNLQELLDVVSAERNEWYDSRVIEEGLLNITNELGNIGYAFVNVVPEATTSEDKKYVNVLIRIGTARKNFIERIDFVNNTRTLDSVIRREMEIIEGDPFNRLKIERSLRNIRGLGYFRNVDVETLPGSAADSGIMRIKVEEQPTGDFSVGVGYSSIEKGTVTLGLNEKNFLGSGRSVKLSASVSDTAADYRIGLTEPYFLNRNLSGSFEVFNEDVQADTVDIERTGLSTSVYFGAADDYYHRVGYDLAKNSTTQKSSEATSLTGEENKSLTSSSVRYTLGRRTLDNRYDPTEGSLFEITEEYSGLGGDVNFLKTRFRSAYYKPFAFRKYVLGLRGEIGYVDGLGDKISQSARFNLGGRRLRGFDAGGVGPRDIGSGSAVGGNKIYSGSVEILSSLGLSDDLGMRWTVFSDFGSVWDTDYPDGVTKPNDNSMRQTLGVGLLWDTAIGPLTFFWADPLSQESHDKTRRFQFNIGTRF